MVEEGLLAAKRKPDLLRERDTNNVVRSGGEGEEEGHLAHWEDDTPAVKERVFVTHRVAHDIAESSLHGPFAYLVEG